MIGTIARSLARIVGLIFVVAGLGGGVILTMIVFAPGGMASKPLGQVWFQNHLESLNLTQAIIQRRLHPALWDSLVVEILGWPAWQGLTVVSAVLLIIGVVLFAMTRRRAR